MEPFLGNVHSRVKNAPTETLFAWTERSYLGGCTLAVDPALYVAPLRQLLWGIALDEAAIEACWTRHLPLLQGYDFVAELYAPANGFCRQTLFS